jgi:signal transduction histidine kinase
LKKRYSADADDMFQRLDRDVARIDVLMGQLLTLSRLEAGLSSAEREDVNFVQLVEEAVADSNLRSRSVAQVIESPYKGSIILGNADPRALRSACENVFAMPSDLPNREPMWRSN